MARSCRGCGEGLIINVTQRLALSALTASQLRRATATKDDRMTAWSVEGLVMRGW